MGGRVHGCDICELSPLQPIHWVGVSFDLNFLTPIGIEIKFSHNASVLEQITWFQGFFFLIIMNQHWVHSYDNIHDWGSKFGQQSSSFSSVQHSSGRTPESLSHDMRYSQKFNTLLEFMRHSGGVGLIFLIKENLWRENSLKKKGASLLRPEMFPTTGQAGLEARL